jgi:Asp-tRNA(Asn)/Glu-tRNA(Gln) amidotransferase A subunit family amidase
VDANKGWFMTYPFNALGRCPVLALPSGFSDSGVPTGIQLVGKPYQDQATLALGATCEQALSPWYFSGVRPVLAH